MRLSFAKVLTFIARFGVELGLSEGAEWDARPIRHKVHSHDGFVVFAEMFGFRVRFHRCLECVQNALYGLKRMGLLSQHRTVRTQAALVQVQRGLCGRVRPNSCVQCCRLALCLIVES